MKPDQKEELRLPEVRERMFGAATERALGYRKKNIVYREMSEVLRMRLHIHSCVKNEEFFNLLLETKKLEEGKIERFW